MGTERERREEGDTHIYTSRRRISVYIYNTQEKKREEKRERARVCVIYWKKTLWQEHAEEQQ